MKLYEVSFAGLCCFFMSFDIAFKVASIIVDSNNLSDIEIPVITEISSFCYAYDNTSFFCLLKSTGYSFI
jgi:hypothetical protein